jgi:hypothetical protein
MHSFCKVAKPADLDIPTVCWEWLFNDDYQCAENIALNCRITDELERSGRKKCLHNRDNIQEFCLE